MPKTFTEPRHALNGPTMGTRWQALFWAEVEAEPLRAALQAEMDALDGMASLWKPESDLMRLNRAAPGDWVSLPEGLLALLAQALEIGRRSGGAYDCAVGGAVSAWGFGPDPASPEAIRAALAAPKRPAADLLELDPRAGRARKHGPARFDLNGIAKGHGAELMSRLLARHGVAASLTALDGELVARGLRPDGTPWPIALERPDDSAREAHSVLALHDAAVATSGDYRHWVTLGTQRLSHTIDPARGGPLAASPASVTVVAPTGAEADGWATALMVQGPERGAETAAREGLSALFLERDGSGFRETRVGPLFA